MRVFFLTSPCSGDYLAQRSWGPFNIFILLLSKHASLFIVIVIQVAGNDSWEHLVAEADVHRCLEGRLQRGGGGQGGQADGGQGGQGDQVLERMSSKPLSSVFSSSQESRLGSLVWGQNDSGCRQSDISLAKGGWIQCRLSKLVANKLLSVLSWLIFMKSCFFQKLKILMNFMGPAWLDFKPYKILSELPCEVLEKILSTSLFVSNLFNTVMFIVQWHNQYWGDVRRQGGLLSKVARSEGTWHRACKVIQVEYYEDLANNAMMSEIQTLNTLWGRDIYTGSCFFFNRQKIQRWW